MASRAPVSVLFVCHGNICRSTMAQSVMGHLVREAGEEGLWTVDSAATSTEELGNPPHPGTVAELARHGIPCVPHRARRMRADELDDWGQLHRVEGALQHVAGAPHEGRGTVEEERDVGAHRAGRPHHLGAGGVEAPKPRQGHERGRGVGRPAAEAGLGRDALVDDDAHVGHAVDRLREDEGRPCGQVVTGGAAHGRHAHHLQGARRLEGEGVDEVHRGHDGTDSVEPAGRALR